ncbi:hypothetical protein [Brevundimonas aveniformis]|uniref:hypothetical protein n=1 Tax=Brevundimonas aveniformis TaxID=370977 RepID=UPI0003FCE21E|nr:hypothetical protein [Brevundimonas aveniformis]
MTDERDHDLVAEEGRPAAAVVWLLYILSIPSAGTLAIVGLIVGYVARGSARGWIRTHFDQQVRIFWQSFWWHILPWVIAAIVAVAFGPVGLLALLLPLLVNLILLIWFTVVSVFGLIALVQAKPVS